MKQSDLIKDRLRNVMLNDKMSSVNQLLTVLRSDIADVMQNYMYISPSDIEVKADAQDNGNFCFTISLKTDCVFRFGKLID